MEDEDDLKTADDQKDDQKVDDEDQKDDQKADDQDGKSADDEKKPSDQEAKLLKEVMALKEKVKKEREAAAAARADVKKFEGLDPQKARDALKKAEAAERAELERKGEYDRILAQIKEQHEAELQAAKEREETERKEREALLARLDNMAVETAFANSRFISDELILSPAKVRALFGEHFEVEDGNIVAYDKPRGAKERTPIVNSRGDSLSFEEAIAKIVKADPDFDRMAKSKLKPGAGSNTTDEGAKDNQTNESKTGFDMILAGLQSRKK